MYGTTLVTTHVYGGKYHTGFRPNENPSKDCLFKRPFCNCKRPADIKEWNGKNTWRPQKIFGIS